MRYSILVLLLCGCSVMGHEKVEGWPHLRVIEHHVPHAQMRDRCAKYVGFGMNPEACAEFHLSRGECHIWFSAEFPPSQAIVNHERLHCAGFDHVGSTNMRNLIRGSR